MGKNGINIKRSLLRIKEKDVHSAICDYIKYQYPDIIFTSDASGMRVSIGLRNELKRKRCARYVIPDLIILQPNKNYHGLILEIKKDVKEVFNSKGIRSNQHIKDQVRTLATLDVLGYHAQFVFGFDNAKKIIDDYLKDAA